MDQIVDPGKGIGIDIEEALFRATGCFREEFLLRARPARIDDMAELQDRQDDDTPYDSNK